MVAPENGVENLIHSAWVEKLTAGKRVVVVYRFLFCSHERVHYIDCGHELVSLAEKLVRKVIDSQATEYSELMRLAA